MYASARQSEVTSNLSSMDVCGKACNLHACLDMDVLGVEAAAHSQATPLGSSSRFYDLMRHINEVTVISS